ncbi:MAG: hypothetical protein AB3N20_14775 [Rhizobiaceae bacterium]
MVQSTLFLLLGFLSAILLALMLAPVVWRRAVAMTERRIEATVPLSSGELRAEKDQVRAEAAMSIRRLETKFRVQNENLTAKKAELSGRLEEIRQLNEENNDQAEVIEGLEADIRELNSKIESLEKEGASLSGELSSACDQIEQHIAENERIARLYDEASLVSSNRQIELVARDAKIEKLSGEIDALKQVRDEVQAEAREHSATRKVAERELAAKAKKIDVLETKIEQMISAMTDAEEKLDRREKELARLKDRIKQGTGADREIRLQLEESEKQRIKLEAQLERGTKETKPVPTNDAALEKKVFQLEEDRSRLENRLKKVVAENRRLKSGNGTPAIVSDLDSDAAESENAELRVQINHLAAEIVNLTAMLDGPDSEISKIIRNGKSQKGLADKSSSIADRVRALREAALSAGQTEVK